MQKAEARHIGVGKGAQEASATHTTNTSSYTWASSPISRMVLRMVVAMLATMAFLFFFTPAAVTAERCFKEVSEPLQDEYISESFSH